MPTKIIDRDSIRGWKEAGSLDTFDRARAHVKELLASYTRPVLDPHHEAELHAYVLNLAKQAGMDELPRLEELEFA